MGQLAGFSSRLRTEPRGLLSQGWQSWTVLAHVQVGILGGCTIATCFLPQQFTRRCLQFFLSPLPATKKHWYISDDGAFLLANGGWTDALVVPLQRVCRFRAGDIGGRTDWQSGWHAGLLLPFCQGQGVCIASSPR